MVKAKHAEYTRGCNVATQWGVMTDRMYTKEPNYLNHNVQWQSTIHKLRQVAVRYSKGEEDPEPDTNLIGAPEQNHNLTDVVIKLQQSNYPGSGNYLGLELNNTATIFCQTGQGQEPQQ